MGLPSVVTQIVAGGLGRVAPVADRVMGLVLTASSASGLQALPPSQLFSVADFDALTASLAPSPYLTEARRQIIDFYAVAGIGAELWVVCVSANYTPAELVTTGTEVASLIGAADGRICVLGFSRYNNVALASGAVSDGLETAVLDSLDELHAFAVQQATAQMPLRIVVDGRGYTGVPANLRNLRQGSFNRVSVCIGSTLSTADNASLGLLLGRLASVPPQRNIGRLSDGVAASSAWLTSKQPMTGISQAVADSLHDKGYIFLRKHRNRIGYYWNDDPTASLLTDDYASLSNGRVIDKVQRIAYNTYLNELLAEVLVDEVTGLVIPSTLKYYQGLIERAIDLTMTAQGEISGVEAYVDPTQDILATNTLIIQLNVVPVATNRTILVKLGLTNPAS